VSKGNDVRQHITNHCVIGSSYATILALGQLLRALSPVLRIAIGKAMIILSRSPIGIELDDDPDQISAYSLRIIRENFEDKDGDGIPDNDKSDGVLKNFSMNVSPKRPSLKLRGGRIVGDAVDIDGDGVPDGIDLDGDGVPDEPLPGDFHFPQEWVGQEKKVVTMQLYLDVRLTMGSEYLWLKVQGNKCWTPSLGQVRLQTMRFQGNAACWWNLNTQQLKLSFMPNDPPTVLWDVEAETCGCSCPDAIEDELTLRAAHLVIRKLYTYPNMIDLELNPLQSVNSIVGKAAEIVTGTRNAAESGKS